MDPIGNQVFSHDYVKYVYQEPDVKVTHHGVPPTKPFNLKGPEKSKKSQKDVDKKKEQKDKDDSTLA